MFIKFCHFSFAYTEKRRAENQRGNNGWLLLLVSHDTISKMIKYKYTRLITKNVTFLWGNFHIDVGRWMIKKRFLFCPPKNRFFSTPAENYHFFTDAREKTRSGKFLKFFFPSPLMTVVIVTKLIFVFFLLFCNGNIYFLRRNVFVCRFKGETGAVYIWRHEFLWKRGWKGD